MAYPWSAADQLQAACMILGSQLTGYQQGIVRTANTYASGQQPNTNVYPIQIVQNPPQSSKVYTDQYDPQEELPPYSGPYPIQDLQRARRSLIRSLKDDSTDIIQRIKPRLGISSSYGQAHQYPLVSPSEDVGNPITPAPGSAASNNVVITLDEDDDKDESQDRLTGKPVPTQSRRPSEKSYPISTVTMVRRVEGEKRPEIVNNLETAGDDDGRTHTNRIDVISRKRKSDSMDNAAVPAKKTSTGGILPIANAQQVYKCDFCNYQGSTRTVVEFHLTQAKHFSASLYNMQNHQLVSIEKKLAVRNKHVKNETLVVVCPECHDLFEDIFMCGVHYKYTHGGDSNYGYYAICPVMHQENILLDHQPICQHCQVNFDKHKALHRHWEREPRHHPLTRTITHNVFALFCCLYCNKTFYGNFLACKSHVLDHRDQNGLHRHRSAMKVRYIMKPLRGQELLPPSESSQWDGLVDELAMLQNMKAHFSGMSATKSKVRAIDQRIKQLEQFRLANQSQYLK